MGLIAALVVAVAGPGCLLEAEEDLGSSSQGIEEGGEDIIDDDEDTGGGGTSCSYYHQNCLNGSCTRPSSGTSQLYWDLANQFRPTFVMSRSKDVYQSYAFNEVLGFVARPWNNYAGSWVEPGGHPEFLVRTTSHYCGSGTVGAVGTCIQIRYAAAYSRDDGYWWIPNMTGDAHLGDSEMVAVLLKNYGTWWGRIATYYSAHHNALDDECGVYIGIQSNTGPLVYVANAKHANYQHDHFCDGGPDDCTNYRTSPGTAPLQDLRRYTLLQYPEDRCRSFDTYNGSSKFGESGSYYKILYVQEAFGPEWVPSGPGGSGGGDDCADCI